MATSGMISGKSTEKSWDPDPDSTGLHWQWPYVPLRQGEDCVLYVKHDSYTLQAVGFKVSTY